MINKYFVFLFTIVILCFTLINSKSSVKNKKALNHPGEVLAGRDVPPQFTKRVRPQKMESRQRRAIEFVEVGNRPSLGNPRTLQLEGESIYVLDAATQQIRRFSHQGIEQQSYGAGHGLGPGQHQHIVGFGVTSEGEVITGDTAARRISIFNASGTFQRSMHPDKAMLRFGLTEEEKAVYLTVPTAVYFNDIEKGTSKEGETLVEDPIKWAGALDGGLRGDARGGVIQFAFYYDVIIRWTANGNIDYIRNMVGDYPDTPLENTGMGYRVYTQGVKYRVNDVSVTENNIHILVVFLNESANDHIIDVYSVDKGIYKYSYKLPEYSRGIGVNGGNIVGLKDTTFAVWERR